MFADFEGSLTITEGTVSGNSVVTEGSWEGVRARVPASRAPASRGDKTESEKDGGKNNDKNHDKNNGEKGDKNNGENNDKNNGKKGDRSNINWSMDGMCGGGLAVSELVDLQVTTPNPDP